MSFRIRKAKPEDIETFVSVVSATGWSHVREAMSFYVTCPEVTPYVAESDSSIVGTGLATSYGGRSGWLGFITVLPKHRHKGIGRALALWGMDWLESQGIATVLLAASAQGRPLYEKFGFVAAGDYLTLKGQRLTSPPLETEVLRPLTPRDWDLVAALDSDATGEARTEVLRRFGAGWVTKDAEGKATGFHIPVPWGGGPAITADESAGNRFVDRIQGARGFGPVTVRVPEANHAAVSYLQSKGFDLVGRETFMWRGRRLDPYRPERIWGMISLALG